MHLSKFYLHNESYENICCFSPQVAPCSLIITQYTKIQKLIPDQEQQ